MRSETILDYSLVSIGLIIIFIGVSHALGQPILVSVTSDSMEPTIQRSDIFIAHPPIGPIHRGDIIIYQPKTLNDQKPITHRVVAVTKQGYITKGDANNYSDQAIGEPPVTDEQVIAKAVQINNKPLVVPFIGQITHIISSGFHTVTAPVIAPIADAIGVSIYRISISLQVPLILAVILIALIRS